MRQELDRPSRTTNIDYIFRQFRQLALGVLEQCYRDNVTKTCRLLTYELKNWSDWTCLSLAVIAHHQEFVAHKCCQMILNDLWMGGMSIRRYLNWKVRIQSQL